MSKPIDLKPLYEMIASFKASIASEELHCRQKCDRLGEPRSYEEQEDISRYRRRAWQEFADSTRVIQNEIEYIAAIIAGTEAMKNPTFYFVGNIGDPAITERVRQIAELPRP